MLAFLKIKKNGGTFKMKHLKALICSIALFAMFAGTAVQAKTEIQWWHAFGGRLVNYLMNK